MTWSLPALASPTAGSLRTSRLWLLLALSLLTACIEDAGDPAPEDGEDAARADAVLVVDAAVDAAPLPPDAQRGDAEVPPDAAVIAPSCGNEDDQAPNQRPEDARPLEPGFERDDLFLCPESSDWFALELPAGQGLNVQLLADPPDVDLDLAVLAQDGSVLAESTGDGGQERIEFAAPADGTYLIRVVGYRDESAFYALQITTGCRLDTQCPADQVCSRFTGQCETRGDSVCGADAFEDNDRDADAAALPPEGVAEGVLCGADRDWFVLEAEAGSTLDLLVAFDAQEDIDVFVIEAATGVEVASARGGPDSNPERLRLSSVPAGRYLVGLVLFIGEGRDREANYRLEVVGRSGGCDVDRDCANPLYPVCDAGICRGVEGGNVPLGERCGQDSDCGPDAELCYTGGAGGHDNFCTRTCGDDAACAGLGAGSICTPVSRNEAVCFPACTGDDDCSAFRTCTQGVCELRGECEGDRDCDAGELCRLTQFGRYCGLPPEVDCGGDGPLDPNDVRDDAKPLPTDGNPLEGLTICDVDTDWLRVTVPPEAAAFTLQAGVTFRAGVDIDIYLYDAGGRLVGEATSPDQTEEVIELRFAAPGDYFLQIDQFSSDALADTAYTARAELINNQDRCTIMGGECTRTEPLRAQCDELTGACLDLPGNGQVALGGLCDSQDDCGPDAEVCWAFEGGAQGYNICTTSCRGDGDCANIPGTECIEFQQFAVCLPPR